MPSSTFAVPACPVLGSMGHSHNSATCLSLGVGSNSNLNSNSNSNHLRPKSSTSARSPSPLFNWARGKENRDPLQLAQAAELSGRRSTSSSLVSTSTGCGGTMAMAAPPPTTDSSKRRDSRSGLPPPLTPEEFDALPVAIQRKYFSTLERLRFAQPSSAAVDGIFDHYCQNSKRRRPRQERTVSDHLAGRLRRRSLRDSSSLLNPNSLAFASTLPDKIKKRQFTREEQVVLARHLRASVILDAADEAVYKVGRRASIQIGPDLGAPAFDPSAALFSQPSMNSQRSSVPTQAGAVRPEAPNSGAPDSFHDFHDTFRWLDDGDDLDLRLFLDDYHANLREQLPAPKDHRRPSFRRHLSISKIPFGRSSVSSSRPATNDSPTSPVSPLHNPPASASHTALPTATRRRSRTMSLITSKHPPAEAFTAIDPSAAHYQDPEARLKLRVYLASPQKFDEAIEFGFPSAEALSASPVIKKGLMHAGRRQSIQHGSMDSDKVETFLADEDDDDDDDKMSVADPDSPKTPHSMERPAARPTRVPSLATNPQTQPEGYAQLPASSREMTLRMTLTRPDLRACENQIYGWQNQQQHQHPQQLPQPQSQLHQHQHQQHRMAKSQSALLRDDMPRPLHVGNGGFDDASRKESIEKTLAGLDSWSPDHDRGVMKRIWNRVRRS